LIDFDEARSMEMKGKIREEREYENGTKKG
jgi:hypothetical protein